MKYRDRALVLRTSNASGLDLNVKLLTALHGVRTAVVKNGQRPSHRLRKRLRVGAHVDVEFYRVHTITHALPIDGLPRHPYVSTVIEAIEQLAGEGPCPGLYALASTMLRSRNPELMVVAFLLQAMSLSGWGMALDTCASCGKPGPHECFSTDAGGAVCERCTPAGAIPIDPDTLTIMNALSLPGWERCTPTATQLRQATALTVSHFQRHLECQLPRG